MNSADIIVGLMAGLDGQGFTVSWPNVDADLVPPYLDTDFLLLPPERQGSTKVHRYRGLFQVTVVHPENDGAIAALAVAEQVKALYPVALQFTAGASSVRIYQTPTIARGLNEGGAYRLPITIPFEIIE